MCVTVARERYLEAQAERALQTQSRDAEPNGVVVAVRSMESIKVCGVHQNNSLP